MDIRINLVNVIKIHWKHKPGFDFENESKERTVFLITSFFYVSLHHINLTKKEINQVTQMFEVFRSMI